MRLTIVVPDTLTCIDGVCYSDIDMSSLNPDVWALQWYEVYGDLETVDEFGARSNTKVYSLEPYQAVIDQWYARNSEQEALMNKQSE